jgi:hypothetical protein
MGKGTRYVDPWNAAPPPIVTTVREADTELAEWLDRVDELLEKGNE